VPTIVDAAKDIAHSATSCGQGTRSRPEGWDIAAQNLTGEVTPKADSWTERRAFFAHRGFTRLRPYTAKRGKPPKRHTGSTCLTGLRFAQLTASPVKSGREVFLVAVLKRVIFAALALAIATPAYAASITVLVGDKDSFGNILDANGLLPCLSNPSYDPNSSDPNQAPCISPIFDWRSAAEQLATNGAQLTDTYSALYNGSESDCPQGCSLNGATGSFILPVAGFLTSGSLTLRIADFETSENGVMLANINGVPIDFSFNGGYRSTEFAEFALTSAMLAAINQVGELRLFLDHSSLIVPGGSFDYIAFDYAELNGDIAEIDPRSAPVPEPGTMLLFGAGLAAIAARTLRKKSR